jgi:hypothetical protein
MLVNTKASVSSTTGTSCSRTTTTEVGIGWKSTRSCFWSEQSR